MKRILKAILRTLGYSVTRDFYSVDSFRTRLLMDQKISTVLDVGANEGQYGQLIRCNGYGGQIVSFEPLHGPFEKLSVLSRKDGRWRVFRAAVGQENGTTTIREAINSQWSSLLPVTTAAVETYDKGKQVREVAVELVTLDEIMTGRESLDPGERLYLKIDVQGYELPVLLGAPKILNQVYAIEVELSLVPIYEGQALFREVVDLLADAGFGIVSMTPAYVDVRTGRLLQVDTILTRSTGA